MVYSAATDYTGAGGQNLPGSAGNTGSPGFGITAAQSAFTVPPEQGQQGKNIAQSLAAFEGLDPQSQANMAEMIWQTGLMDPSVYRSGQVTQTALLNTFGKLLVMAHDQGKALSLVISQQIADQKARGAIASFPGMALRTLGLGRYPIELTSTAALEAAGISIVQQLLGRMPTQGELAAVTGIVHNAELKQKTAEFQQYQEQQVAQAELFHGGAAQAAGPKTFSLGDIQFALGGAGAVTGQAPQPGAPGGGAAALGPGAAGGMQGGNYVPPANVAAHPPPGAPSQGAIAAPGQPLATPAQTAGAPRPVNAPMQPTPPGTPNVGLQGLPAPAAAAGAQPGGVPTAIDQSQVASTGSVQGSSINPNDILQRITLADGTVLLIPRQQVGVQAPTAGEAWTAYTMQTQPSMITGRVAASALSAMANALGKPV